MSLRVIVGESAGSIAVAGVVDPRWVISPLDTGWRRSAPVAAGADRRHPVSRGEITHLGSTTPATAIEPALSPTITRKLIHVIPANLQIDARWDAIRNARDAAKRKNGKHAPSPSVMIAWAVVRAMEKHPPFRRLILEDERIVENENFDLAMAVALEGDRLATVVVVDANKKTWPEFVKIYNETVDA